MMPIFSILLDRHRTISQQAYVDVRANSAEEAIRYVEGALASDDTEWHDNTAHLRSDLPGGVREITFNTGGPEGENTSYCVKRDGPDGIGYYRVKQETLT
jgi:hypothetical protein